MLALLGFGGFVAFAALYARELGFERPGLIFALFGAVVVLVRTFGRKLPDRLGARRTLVLCFVNLAIGLATIGAWQTETGLLVGTAIFAVGQALSYPAAVLLAMETSSEAERSAVVGGVTAFRRRRARRRSVHAWRRRGRHRVRRRVPRLVRHRA